jgi:hypothetical protein
MLMSSATTEAVVRAVEAALRAGLIPARAEKGTTFDISGFVLLAGAVRNQPASFVHRQTSEPMVCSMLVPDSCRPEDHWTRGGEPMVTIEAPIFAAFTRFLSPLRFVLPQHLVQEP